MKLNFPPVPLKRRAAGGAVASSPTTSSQLSALDRSADDGARTPVLPSVYPSTSPLTVELHYGKATQPAASRSQRTSCSSLLSVFSMKSDRHHRTSRVGSFPLDIKAERENIVKATWRRGARAAGACCRHSARLCATCRRCLTLLLVLIVGACVVSMLFCGVDGTWRRLLTPVQYFFFSAPRPPHMCDTAPCGPMRLPIAVLVQHSGAARQLTYALAHQTWPPPTCAEDAAFCRAATGGDQRLSRDLLPSWTLQTVDGACADCVDGYAHGAAVQGVRLRGRHGVFALPRSPRGLLGPMLLGMLSVTDDVDAAAELPRWSWLRHAYADFPAAGRRGGGAAARPLLAVMGIPSTDHPARRALRDAQRATWMSYHEVARSENGFDGALLPLFLFAAAEAYRPATAAAQAALATTAALCPLCHNVSLLLPTRGEFVAGSRAALAVEEKKEAAAAAGAGRVGVTAGVAVRRVVLRRDWRTAAAGDSPCADVATRAVAPLSMSAVPPPLRAALSLPVTPAFVAPADYICCASAALWREALDHRNVVWLDMMTDRKPTTNKTLGTSERWGLPAEIGMSQKLVMWLTYAYHNFRDVPFIIKGDDDAYVKVPQYLSDIRFFSSGGRVRTLAQGSHETSVVDPDVRLAEDTQMTPDAVECAYWGSMRNFYAYEFSAGMNFKVHRRLVQAMMEQYYRDDEPNWMRFAMDEYSPAYMAAYRKKMFHHEDIMLGVTVGRVFTRARELCRDHRVWFIKEDFTKMHDMHRGKLHNVTWSTVVAHRITPADAYFLHYYFQHEHMSHNLEKDKLGAWEAAARASALTWAAAQHNNTFRSSAHTYTVGWDDLPDVEWTRLPNMTRLPPFVVMPEDHVAVYESEYTRWEHNATRVFHGLLSHVFPYSAIPI